MKIKMIDLLVKIANGEESTNVKTKYDSADWDKNDFLLSVYNEFGERNNDEIVDFLNDYVEIIEEPKKIEKLKAKYTSQVGKLELANKINELIDEINNLKEED